MRTWPSDRVVLGGDYNPEQWPDATLDDDVARMRECGVGFATVGVFSWALLEPEPGRYETAWLDRVLDRLHDAGIAVDLATATAAPPPWFARLHPDAMPVTRDGTRLSHGSRQTWCPSSPDYRRRSLALVELLARRYAGHPALAMWHVGNEFGCHNLMCFCDTSAAHFRTWLQGRYGTTADPADALDSLNEAWGTTFWSQRYTSWDDVVPPRATTAIPNPTAELDWRRFCSDASLEQHLAERDLLHELSPGVPVTTNFMVGFSFDGLDYHRWAPHQDVVSNDHYLAAHLPDAHVELAMSADITRGLAGGDPWVLMEHSTSAVNWQPVNTAKPRGQMLRDSLSHVARGADAVGFFQWRASRAGAEKYHSALLPHAGTDSRRWQEVVELGRVLDAVSEAAGSRTEAHVALVHDYDSLWTTDAASTPSTLHRYRDELRAWYGAAWRAGLTVCGEHPEADLSRYRVVLVPSLHLVSDAGAASIAAAAEAGAQVLVTYFSGTVDPDDHIRLGGYPGAFRDLLGVRVEEFVPLLPGTTTALRTPPGSAVPALDRVRGSVWSEWGRAEPGTEVVAEFADGPCAGDPAVTRRAVGAGSAWYCATRLPDDGTDALVAALAAAAGVRPVVPGLPPGVDAVRRRGDGGSWVFVLDHTGEGARVPLAGTDLVTGRACSAEEPLVVGPGGVAVVREGPGGSP
ncbi:beta-galactosidase [Aquipuribacter nitratireducens]|uniref:Beta-galactosidase n=1 Tax=Aquipuribacter nitratireducens TaxID=650104 RepID=A0ABW0GLE4_9MICO